MATFEYQKIQWTYQGNPLPEINQLAQEGWRVVAGGGEGRSRGAQTSVSWVIMEREIQNQSNFNKS